MLHRTAQSPYFKPSVQKAAKEASPGLSEDVKAISLVPPRAANLVKTAFGKSPISRQKDKEEAFKRRLSRCSTSWWDAAAVGFKDATVATNRHLDRTSCHAEDTLMDLAKGRNHAQRDLK